MKYLFISGLLMTSFVSKAQQIGASPIYYNGSNVGIGTPNPNTLFEIRKEVPMGLGPVFRLTGGGSLGAQVAIELATYDPGAGNPAAKIVATDDAYWGCNIDFIGKISGANGNGMETRLRIGNNGNVGIGTLKISDANYRLFVANGIRTEKVKVDQTTNWPDYVFQPSYQLLPLQEVEQYIQQNHHLPDVPSAEKVKEEGLDLGDNQAVLLKKIEEMTLYLIEQNKKIASLEKELQQLKSSTPHNKN